MPELPEVETIRKGLSQKIFRKKIKNIRIFRNSAIRLHSSGKFIKALRGVTFLDIERYGKLLVFYTNKEDLFLLAHLKMTGQFVYSSVSQKPTAHTRVLFQLEDGSSMAFNDMWTFGYIKLVGAAEKALLIKKGFFGLEPLSPAFTPEALRNIFRNSKTFLKRVLLDQTKIAGIGNIYADEICFASSLHPAKNVSELSDGDSMRLCKYAKAILKKAILYRGTTFGTDTRGHYVDSAGRRGGYAPFLKVYKQEGMNCFRCGKERIKKIIVAGRGTRFCPRCQKKNPLR